jgi:hypothetical protein
MEEQATNVMINLAGRYFQMEEMEDSETRTTGMILEPNGTITTLISDIPCLKEAFGTWEQQPQKGAAVAAEEDPGKQQQVQIQRIMTRTFTTGAPKILETDMGEFEFSMERRYTGELCLIGESVGIEGGIHLIHHHENNKWGADETNKVGFFSMIDTETNPDDDQAFDPARGFSLLSTGR